MCQSVLWRSLKYSIYSVPLQTPLVKRIWAKLQGHRLFRKYATGQRHFAIYLRLSLHIAKYPLFRFPWQLSHGQISTKDHPRPESLQVFPMVGKFADRFVFISSFATFASQGHLSRNHGVKKSTELQTDSTMAFTLLMFGTCMANGASAKCPEALHMKKWQGMLNHPSKSIQTNITTQTCRHVANIKVPDSEPHYCVIPQLKEKRLRLRWHFFGKLLARTPREQLEAVSR